MKLSVAVTADIDNDGASLTDERDRLSWRGLDLVPTIADIIHARGFPVTWFVRADSQLRDFYGTVSYLLEDHHKLWRNLKNLGDEIGWHPHLNSAIGDGVYRPERNEIRMANELRCTHAALTAQGHEFVSVRLGEAIGNNATMDTLADLGLRVDSSAIPGRQRVDHSRTFDWATSPNVPYWPSVADYRVPGVPALSILEVPMTAFSVQAPYDPAPLLRYANLAYRPKIFFDAMTRWFDCDGLKGPNTVLTLILHPDELMMAAQDHPLYAFTLHALQENIDALLNAARRRKIDLTGCTLSGIVDGIVRERTA
jgi:hypothetical protein